MLQITLPDGAIRQFDKPVTGIEIAQSISSSLGKKAIAVKRDGMLMDAFISIETDAKIEIITRDSPEGLDLIRHDTAHLMAQAVQELFPDTQVTIGPNIEDGFYYDFARDTPFSSDDFTAIEKKMRQLVAADLPTRRVTLPRAAAIAHFEDIGERYKADIIRDLPEGEEVSIYYHGDWHDLCRGPHLPSTKHIGTAFKLMKLAGAYWRGDSNNAMLQRIYGTAWEDTKALEAYLTRIKEAEARDHRKIGREMELFHLQEEAQGSVFWHPKGYVMWLALEAFIRRRLAKAGYIEVKTPQLLDSKFWEKSGHWDKFREEMFIVPDEIPNTEDGGPIISADAKLMALKPMNCPAHVQIFKQGIKSYRDLPIRMAEFGCCHRNEPHGALQGLMRVRQMTQDDAHIFARVDQIEAEVAGFCRLLSEIYADLGFEKVKVFLATRPEMRAGSDEIWDRAEADLEAALKTTSLAYEFAPGEGAFYGPKLEFHLKDAIGRSWQCGTLQLDFVMPERLEASYVAEDGARHRPVMLHRAILGSLERFLGILIENYAGKMPLWLAPTQLVVATITSDTNEYAAKVAAQFEAVGLRVVLDQRNEKINYKIREHSHAKVPLIAVVGTREAETEALSLRRLGSKQTTDMRLTEAISLLMAEAKAPDM